jgi:heme A synthase
MNRTGTVKTDRGFARLALVAAAVTFGMIIIGAITRVSGSGMGCGTDWPVCNGRIIPSFEGLQAVATLIEYGHRLFALIVGIATVAVMVQAFRLYRKTPRIYILAILALVLYFLQSALGAITVWMSNEWLSVMLHLANSMLLLACFVIIWVNARPAASGTPVVTANGVALSAAVAAAGLAFLVVLLGAVVAGNNALKACGDQFITSWPLCLNTVWPANFGTPAELNMIHRIAAGLLGVALVLLAIQAWRNHADALTRQTIIIAGILYLTQAAMGALVILVEGTNELIVVRSLHVTFSAATWWAMIALSGVTWLQQSYRNKITQTTDHLPPKNNVVSSATISN